MINRYSCQINRAFVETPHWIDYMYSMPSTHCCWPECPIIMIKTCFKLEIKCASLCLSEGDTKTCSYDNLLIYFICLCAYFSDTSPVVCALPKQLVLSPRIYFSQLSHLLHICLPKLLDVWVGVSVHLPMCGNRFQKGNITRQSDITEKVKCVWETRGVRWPANWFGMLD